MSVTRRLSSEAGFGLVEVMVTAMIVLILASGVLTGLNAASHASGRVKQRSVAMTLAQQDQERLRAMVIGDLANVRESQTRTITVCSDSANTKGCTPYTVASQADWVSDSAGVESCTQATTKDYDFDYLKITSKVTWPGMDVQAVTTASMLTPRVGDIGQNTGSLAAKVLRADGKTGVPNVRVTLNGPDGQFTDVTNGAGCVVWGALAVGNGYTLAVNEPGFVDVNGDQEASKTVGVSMSSVSASELLYDGAAGVDFSFKTVANGNTYTGQKTDVVSLVQNQMLPVTRTVGTSGSATALISATSLFPFSQTSTGGRYVAFAGDCNGENPSSQVPADGALQTLPNLTPGSTAAVTIQIPSIDTKVTVPGTSGVRTADQPGDQAVLKFTETTPGCLNTGGSTTPVQTSTGTDPGHPANPGARYGVFTVCAQAMVGSPAKVRSVTVNNVAVKALDGAKVTSPSAATGTMNITASSAQAPCA